MFSFKKMGLDYRLCLNPHALLDKEMLLVYSGIVTDTQLEVEKLYETPSLRPIPYSEELLANVDLKPLPKISHLDSPITTYSEFFSDYDLFYLIKAIKESESIGLFKILPYNQTESRPYKHKTIRLIPSTLKEINEEEYPLSIKIKQAYRKLKRNKLLQVASEHVKS